MFNRLHLLLEKHRPHHLAGFTIRSPKGQVTTVRSSGSQLPDYEYLYYVLLRESLPDS